MIEENHQQSEIDPRLGRTKLLVIVGIVFIPLTLASVMYFYFPQLAPSGTTNEGTFILPPIQLTDLEVEGLKAEKWTLIFIGDGQCDDDCRAPLYMARQIHIAMGKNINRVGRIYLVTGGPLQPEFASYLKTSMPKMVAYPADRNKLRAHFGSEILKTESIGANKMGIDISQLVFLMDPLGNIILYYTHDKIGKPLQKDLKRLLKLSQIG